MKIINKIIIFSLISLLLIVNKIFAEGWVSDGKDLYWQADDGSYRTGFIIIDEGVFYCGVDGKMVKSKEPGSWMLVNDSVYQNQFYVDEYGIVSMNNNNEPHWVKSAGQWYHYNKNGVIDKDKWIYDKKLNKIYRVDYEGRMCRGWVADPYTHIEYYMAKGEDGGYLVMDNMDSTYQESFDRLIAIINENEKADESGVAIPNDNGG